MGALIVQLLLGGYQFSFTTGAGRPESDARASRLPSPVIFGHMLLAIVIALLWAGQMASDSRAMAWVVFGLLVGSVASGLAMFLRTARRSAWIGGRSRNPADHRVAEKQIPVPSLAVHGLVALSLVVGVLLVALGVAD